MKIEALIPRLALFIVLPESGMIAGWRFSFVSGGRLD